MPTEVLETSGYATQVNKHTGLEMNDEATGWSQVSTAVTATRQGSFLLIQARSDNAGDLLVTLNGGAGVVPIPAGQGRTFSDFPITSFQVTNAGASYQYHFELFLD